MFVLPLQVSFEVDIYFRMALDIVGYPQVSRLTLVAT